MVHDNLNYNRQKFTGADRVLRCKAIASFNRNAATFYEIREIMKVLLFTLFLTASNIAFANGWLTRDGTGIINDLKAENGLFVVNYSASDKTNPDNCTKSDVAIVDDQTINGERQVALLMAAHFSERNILLYATGCTVGWGNTYPKIHAVIVR